MSTASYQALKAAAVDKLCLGHVIIVDNTVAVVCITTVSARMVFLVPQVDIGAVLLVVFVCQVMYSGVCGIFRVTDSTSNCTLFTTTKDLEGIAAVQVDGSAAPDFRVTAIAAAKHVQRTTQRVHTLFTEKDARIAFGDAIVSIIQFGFTLVFFHLVEDGIITLTIHQRRIQVDHHVTVHMTIAIAAAIDVAALETAVKVFRRIVSCGCLAFCCSGDRVHRFVFLGLWIESPAVNSVPFQTLRLIVLIDPPLRLNLQTAKVEYQLIAVVISIS